MYLFFSVRIKLFITKNGLELLLQGSPIRETGMRLSAVKFVTLVSALEN